MSQLSNYNSKFSHFKVSPVCPGVVHVEINRPQTVNAFGPTTWEQYHGLFSLLGNDPSVRVIVLSGVGKHFCSGLNLKESLPSLLNTNDPHDASFVERFQECINIPVDISKPVISVAHGVSFGLALDIVSATTIRLCTKDTRFSIKEIDIGIMADIGSLQRISCVVGNVSKVNELALTGDEFSGVDAKELGLVSDVYDTKEEAVERAFQLAKIISGKYIPAVVGTKKHLEQMNVNSDLVKQGLISVARDNTELICDDEFKKFFSKVVKRLGSKL